MNRNRFPLLSLAHGAVLAAVMAACLVISSCAFGDKEDVVPTLSGENSAIYVAGCYNDHACFWVLCGSIPVRVMLPEPSGVSSSLAKSILVDDKNIYVSGSWSDGSTRPIVWVNGVPTLFGYQGASMMYSSLAVHNRTIYVTGQLSSNPCLYVNGRPTILSLASGMVGGGYATSVSVTDTGIVVGGYQQDGSSNNHACLWVDGNSVILDNQAAVNSYVWAVKMENGHIYAAGSLDNLPAMWIDGALRLRDISIMGEIDDIAVKDGIPYMAGLDFTPNTGFLFLANGTRQTVYYNANGATARGIQVFDDAMTGRTILIAGRVYNGSQMSAILWVNGSIVTLDSFGAASTNVTEAWSVTLGPNFLK